MRSSFLTRLSHAARKDSYFDSWSYFSFPRPNTRISRFDAHKKVCQEGGKILIQRGKWKQEEKGNRFKKGSFYNGMEDAVKKFRLLLRLWRIKKWEGKINVTTLMYNFLTKWKED